jgi:hypothetical protein
MTRVPLVLALALVAVAACSKTCPRTWARIKKCAGADRSLDADTEQAFRERCKKLDKPRLKRCLAKDGCERFQTCLAQAEGAAPGRTVVDRRSLCDRAIERALRCETSSAKIDSETRRLIDDMCKKVRPEALTECLDREECKEYQRCLSRAFLDTPATKPPSASAPAPATEKKDEVRLEVGITGEVMLGGISVSLDRLTEILTVAKDKQPGLKVLIATSSKIPYATLVKVLQAVTAAGVQFALSPSP